MQIEESFRDLKCHRWGFGLRYARSHTAKRLEILLLLGTLATLVAWLVGPPALAIPPLILGVAFDALRRDLALAVPT